MALTGAPHVGFFPMPLADKIVTTLGEGTFGKVVKVIDMHT